MSMQVTALAAASILESTPLSTSRLSLLVDLSSLLAREVDFDALLTTACERLAKALRSDRASIWLVDAESGELVTRVAVLPEVPALRQPIDRGIAGYVARTGEVVRVDDAHRDPRFDPSADKATGYTTRSMLVAPIREDGSAPTRGVVQLLNRASGPFDDEDERYLVALATQLARAFSMTTLRAADGGNPGLVLQGPFNRIVGRSERLAAVYEKVQLAAQTDATVLLRGETGTGKGLFARAIHVNSRRQARPFITVDCTTLPTQLVESELFGHERGAFTGADRRVPGKVELAEGGTLFLDELGDLPLDIQGKLLRFLQERTFERVGGRQTMRADVRLVCATHCDLERFVAEGRFRKDLYYRVRVVEIELPPLRERGPEEVEALARHFADHYSTVFHRPSPRFDADAIAHLRGHDWPGNVRELEHWVESAIALAPDGRITTRHLPARHSAAARSAPLDEPPPSGRVSLLDSPPPSTTTRGGEAPLQGEVLLPLTLTLDDAARRYCEAMVRACDGNKTEAAKRLNVGRNTLARALKGKEQA
ncbi:sigma-54-dependent Fis family transcriptional regulator [Chondromyces crocatus]|uniref:Fis family transcriptional regulator n=1 Tax=Chondromyces crocatus TaxID=52 RepID=A0A0K1ESX5_CHOCO|nr:sigma-54-dependent Fis family transcriptional regulator [Chondromyces crocatus]AKT44035.1 Fis family transcriptional regulator [Chondromyces crocatus]